MKSNRHLFTYLLVLAVALAIRVWNSTAIALWHDEAFSALLIQMPFAEMMQRIALDVHPPLYYWLLRLWSGVFGFELWSLRSFSVFFGFLSVPMLYILVKSLTKKSSLAIASAGLLAVNAFHIKYSLEARMYTLGTFLILLSTWVMLKAIRTNKWSWWVFFGVLTAASAYNHYFMFFSILSQALFLSIWWLKNQLKKNPVGFRWVGSFLLSFILYIPWLKTFWSQLTQVQENFWIPPTTIGAVGDTIWKILIGGFTSTDKATLIISAIFISLVFIVYVYRYGRNIHGWILPIMGFVPFVLATLISLKTNLFLDRYFIFSSIFVTATIALTFYSDKYKKASTAVIVFLMVVSTAHYTYAWTEMDAPNSPGMAGASQYLTTNTDPQDKVIISSTFIFFNHRYYNGILGPEKIAKPLLYQKGISDLSQLPHFSGTALLENEDFVPDLTDHAKHGETIWLLWTTGFDSSKPELPDNWIEASEEIFPDILKHKGEIFVTKFVVE